MDKIIKLYFISGTKTNVLSVEDIIHPNTTFKAITLLLKPPHPTHYKSNAFICVYLRFCHANFRPNLNECFHCVPYIYCL